MTIIGIDPSMNCTGVCVSRDDNNIYYMLPAKPTKKMKEFKHKYINIIPIKKEHNRTDYAGKELDKTINIYNICMVIDDIINKYKPSKILIEGMAYNASGTVADLGGLNYCLRMLAIKYDIPLEVVSPTSVKKFAVGNGGAEKDVIIDAWKRIDINVQNIEKGIKIDDLADSYFIAHFTE